MVEIASTPRRGLRAPRLVEIVLALSLTLNLCVAGGFVFSRWSVPVHIPAPAGFDRSLEVVVGRLGIDPTQSKPYADLHHKIKVARDRFFVAHRPLGDQIWNELAKPEPDPARLKQLLDTSMETRRDFQGEVMTAMAAFLATLTPDQRDAFVKIARDRQDPTGQPLRVNIGN